MFSPAELELAAEAVEADIIFALRSVLYSIIVGIKPYADLSESNVKRFFKASEFPDVQSLSCISVICGCWEGSTTTAEQVVENLTALYPDF